MVRRHPGRPIAVVAHGGVNRIILCALLRIPLEHLFTIEQDYAALNVLEFSAGIPRVRSINHTAALKDPVTRQWRS
jgi:broad specificity phosphatase PhoE